MAKPTGWYCYNQFLHELGKGLHDFTDPDTYKVALVTSSSNAINRAMSPATYGSLTNEVAAGNGYSTGGVSIGSPTWTDNNGVEELVLSNAEWVVSGAGITFRAAVLYNSTTGKLLAYFIADSTPANVVAPAGKPLVIGVGLWLPLKQLTA